MSLLGTVLTPLGRALRNRRADESLSIRHKLPFNREITLSSPAFPAGGTIPDRYCSMDLGPNTSPEFTWSEVPSNTAQLLFVMEDIDVPTKAPSIHTIALLPPSWTTIPEGALTPDNPSVHFIRASRGRVGYLGPRPIPGHGTHRYGFHLYALSTPVPASAPGYAEVVAAATENVLADGFLEAIKVG